VAKINLSRMDVASLMELRKRVEDALSGQRTKLEKQLQALGKLIFAWARTVIEGEKGCAKISRSFR
jgi:hypothetical protein